MAADLSRALDYPYGIPDASYCLDLATGSFECAPLTLRQVNPSEGACAGRYDVGLTFNSRPVLLRRVCPVIAAGSNASPAQLLRKFRDSEVRNIYSLKARFSGAIPVYSAHFTSYGAISAFLERASTAESELFVSFLDNAALSIMHATESLGVNYEFERADFVQGEASAALIDGACHYYRSMHGPLVSEKGAPIALSAFSCRAPGYSSRTEEEVLQAAARILAPESSLSQFVDSIVSNPNKRSDLTAALKTVRIGTE